jgi:hypothetical protein
MEGAVHAQAAEGDKQILQETSAHPSKMENFCGFLCSLSAESVIYGLYVYTIARNTVSKYPIDCDCVKLAARLARWKRQQRVG